MLVQFINATNGKAIGLNPDFVIAATAHPTKPDITMLKLSENKMAVPVRSTLMDVISALRT